MTGDAFINHHGAWLPSVSIGLPTLAFLAFVMLVLTLVCLVVSEGDFAPFAVFFGLVFAGAVIAPMFGYWPYHADYHKLQPVTGVVQTVDTRYLAASQFVVVTYQGGQIVRCDDSRCATVKPGDELRLLCTKQHDFGSPLAVDGWACRWGEQ